jgi:DNA polymerase-4
MRSIVSLDIDAFPVALEQSRWPGLRGRPVALAAEEKTPVRILSASREARGEGVFPGMLLSAARRECRSLVVLPPEEMLYRAASATIAKFLERFAPRVEEAAPGRFFLDATGVSRMRPPRDLALRVLREVEGRASLHGALGTGTSKLVSGIAARLIQPDGDVCEVDAGGERDFLAPLPVRLLPGVGASAERALLDELNIRIIAQLAAIPPDALAAVFGRRAVLLRRFALGVDDRPVLDLPGAVLAGAGPGVVPGDARGGGSPGDGLEAEERLVPETNDDALLLASLARLVAGVGSRLRERGRVAGALGLEARYVDGRVGARTLRVVPPSDLDPALFGAARDLFPAVVARRRNVRLLRLRALRLSAGALQGDLFRADPSGTARTAALYRAIDRVRVRFGEGVLRTAGSLPAPAPPGSAR